MANRLEFQAVPLAMFVRDAVVAEFVADDVMLFEVSPFPSFESLTNYLIDEDGNRFSDESGDRITW